MEIETLPDGLRVRAPAKLNLYLEVGGLRPDGFHELDGIFQTISLHDELELRLRDDGRIVLEEEGIDEGERNLVHRAAVALRGASGPRFARRGAHIRLEKRIPHGSGLGGGSSDAAATLIALARLWDIPVSLPDLREVGAGLGSDVPFFFHGGTARCRGRGERVTPWPEADAAEPFHHVIVCPGVHTSTRDVYAALDPSSPSNPSSNHRAHFTLTRSSPIDSMPVAEFLDRLREGEVVFNRLEAVSCRLRPELGEVASRMKGEPFTAVAMTGSGSAFFGMCRTAGEAERLARCVAARLAPEVQVLTVQSRPSYRFPWLSGGGG